jgi:hypothetical protein
MIHLLGDRSILQSNLSNSQAMYRAALEPGTLLRAAELIGDGASPVFAFAGVLALLFVRRRNWLRNLILILCLPILVQFVALASGKPGEYARFGLVIDISLMLLTASGIAVIFKSTSRRILAMSVLCAACAVWSAGYVWHFGRDSIDRTGRMIIAERLQQTYQNGARELAMYADPAPYCLPAVNLFDWKMVLLDPGAAPSTSTDVLIKPIDTVPASDPPMLDFDIRYWTHARLLDTPISWASKPFRVLVRKPFAASDHQ